MLLKTSNRYKNMDKISSLQSLSDYGLGDSDIEDSDNEETTTQVAKVYNSAPEVRSAPRVVTTSSRLVSYGEEDEDDLAASHGGLDAIVVENIANSPAQEIGNTEDETAIQDNNDKDANENNVEDKSQSSFLRISSTNVVLPPEPAGRCSMSLQDRIKTFLEKKHNGVDLNGTIQRRKDFRNPSIYEKLVSFLKIQENGTNYPSSLFDPDAWAKEPSYEALAKAQKEAYEKKEKEKAKRTQIEFLSGTKKPSAASATVAAAIADEAKKRKSKWDISAAPSVLPDVSKKTKL